VSQTDLFAVFDFESVKILQLFRHRIRNLNSANDWSIQGRVFHQGFPRSHPMRAGNESKVPAFSFRWLLAFGLAGSFAVTACNGDIGGVGGGTGVNPTGGTPTGQGSAGSSGLPPSTGFAGSGLPPMTGAAGTGGVVTPPPKGVDPGRISIHRLNNLEYDNTIRDLLGVPGMAQATFQPDEQGEFDNTADAFTMNDARYEQYFNAADALGEAVFANAAAKAKIMTCAPASATDMCTNTIITNFGKRAWRRPLDAPEVTRLITLAGDAVKLGETAEGGVKQVVKTMLASPQFLYRIEFDQNPASLTPHAVGPYELASRLSYLGWSSMPDDTMFAAAANSSITTDIGIASTIDRMLADTAKGNTFTQSFAGQWLGARDMKGHQVEPTAFASFDEPLRTAMINEQLSFFNEFFTAPQPQPFTSFFTYDMNFVDARLAKHYGIPGVTSTTPVKMAVTNDTRVGFMGLASFLTFTSFSYRTAPTLRGKWVLLNLLCQTIPDPPANVPKLDTGAAADPALQSQNVRTRLAAHRTQSDCAACHATLDPIGLGLENFDAIGAYRMKYANGDVIDSSGVLPTKEMFSSVQQLAGILSTGNYATKMTNCVSQKMMTYALSRALVQTDQPYLEQVRAAWSDPAQGWNLKNLLKDIVLNETFRSRRGEQ